MSRSNPYKYECSISDYPSNFEGLKIQGRGGCKQETTRPTVKYLIVPAFPLRGKSNYVAAEFSAGRRRAIISWDHYLTT